LHDEEVLFGGQAGGSKTSALLLAALQYVDVPGYSALIIRRTEPELWGPSGVGSRALEWLVPTDATYNGKHLRFTFPSGASLTFGYLAHSDDKYRYQGHEYQFVGFDELTTIPVEADYLYLKSRLRRPSSGPLSRVPIRVRATSNPGGRGHRWVKARFIDGPGVFLPARLADNPHLDQEDYTRQLEGLDEHTRAQLLHGDWSSREPGPWVYQHEHLDRAFALGATLDADLLRGELGEPDGGELLLGADLSGHCHVVLGWPIAGDGMYVVREWVDTRPDYRLLGRRVALDLNADLRLEGLTVHRHGLRFDAAHRAETQQFVQGFQQVRPGEGGPLLGAKGAGIAFSKHKMRTVGHHRSMLERTAAGSLHWRLAISAAGCPVLRDEIYEYAYQSEESDNILKRDDHGPDALVALDAPLAANARATPGGVIAG
jgi:hypothetical protein